MEDRNQGVGDHHWVSCVVQDRKGEEGRLKAGRRRPRPIRPPPPRERATPHPQGPSTPKHPQTPPFINRNSLQRMYSLTIFVYNVGIYIALLDVGWQRKTQELYKTVKKDIKELCGQWGKENCLSFIFLRVNIN